MSVTGSQFDTLTSGPGGGSGEGLRTPGAYTTGQFSTGAGTYSAQMSRQRAYYKISLAANPPGSRLRVFVVADGQVGGAATFNAQGDGVLNGAWHEAASGTSPTSDGTGLFLVRTGYLGQATGRPAWCDAPTDGPGTGKGWRLVATLGVVENNFQYSATT
jgi:hypothetical protein